MIRENDLIYIDALDRLGRDYDGIITEWKYITRELKADIVCLDNETLFDSRKYRTMGDFGKSNGGSIFKFIGLCSRTGAKEESAKAS